MQVIFRVDKLKTVENIVGSLAHMNRARPTLNANPEKQNVVLVAPPPMDQIMDVIREKLGGHAPRKNAVLASDILISASPAYFRPEEPHRAGYWEPARLQAWRNAVEPWIREKFPDAIAVVLHLDEVTPHYTVTDIPLNEKTGQLSHRKKYGGDSRLSIQRWQDLAVEPVAHLGLKRGIAGSVATHEDIVKFYEAVNTSTPPLPEIVTPDPVEPGPSPGILDPAALAEWNIAKAKAATQRTKRAEEQRIYDAAAAALLPQLSAKAALTDIAQRQAEAYKKTAETLAEENLRLRALSGELRGIRLADVLKKVYGVGPADDAPSSATKSTFGPVEVNGQAWADTTTGKRGLGALELVMHLSGLDFSGAVATLRDGFGQPATVGTAMVAVTAAADSVRARLAAVPPQPPPLPVASAAKWPSVREWLTKVCAIPARLVDELAAVGKIFANRFAAIVYARDHGGFAIRGTGESTFKSLAGNAKECGGITLEGSGDVVVVDEPLEAFSRKAMDADSHVFCTLGPSGVSPDQMARQLPKGRPTIIALPGAAANQKRAATLAQELAAAGFDCRSETSVKKDWNTDLQHGFAVVDPRWISPGGDKGEFVEAISSPQASSDEVGGGTATIRPRNKGG